MTKFNDKYKAIQYVFTVIPVQNQSKPYAYTLSSVGREVHHL